MLYSNSLKYPFNILLNIATDIIHALHSDLKVFPSS